jgi:hypothetical protein
MRLRTSATNLLGSVMIMVHDLSGSPLTRSRHSHHALGLAAAVVEQTRAGWSSVSR